MKPAAQISQLGQAVAWESGRLVVRIPRGERKRWSSDRCISTRTNKSLLLDLFFLAKQVIRRLTPREEDTERGDSRCVRCVRCVVNSRAEPKHKGKT